MGQMSRGFLFRYLRAHGVAADLATLYAVAFLEYEAAQDNIGRLGAVVSNPRTGVPIDNPFLKVRDACERKLTGYADKLPEEAVAELWSYLDTGEVPVLEDEPGAAPDGADDLGSAFDGVI